MAKVKSVTEMVGEAHDMLANRKLVLAEAEKILERQCNESRQLSYEETDFLNNVVGWTRQKISENSRRVSRRIMLQHVAGTSDDRKELDKLTAAAQAELANRGPGIEAEIARLQTELAGLDKKAASFTKRQEEVQTALEQLTKLCSPEVQQTVDCRVQHIEQTLGRDILDATTDLNAIKGVVAGPVDKHDSHYWTRLKLFDRSLVDEGAQADWVTYSYSSAWPAAKDKLLAEIATRESQIAELEARRAVELEKVEADLRQYWR
jgi:hypothetical protein